MRLLTGIKLINWHFFSDEDIDIENSALITGDNGAGKSTLIDALQVVLVGNLAKVRFNSSAFDEKTNRDLKGYLKGKTGTEGETVFLRNDKDFTSYIVLEITHTKTNTPYLIGVLFDYYQDRDEFEHVFFKIDGENINDELFYQDINSLGFDKKEDVKVIDNKNNDFNDNSNNENYVENKDGDVDIEEKVFARNKKDFFRQLKAKEITHKQYKNDLSTYLNDLRQLFGGAKESFFSLIQKGISFTPITNLRGFIYDYILEERQIDVNTMREYFERFQQLEKYIEETKTEITRLSEINETYETLKEKEQNITTADYMIKRAGLEEKNVKNSLLEKELQDNQEALSNLLQDIDDKQTKKTELNKRKNEISEEIANNNTTLKINKLKQEIKTTEEKLGELKSLKKNLYHRIKSEAGEFEKLKEILQTFDDKTDIKDDNTINNNKTKDENIVGDQNTNYQEINTFEKIRKLKEITADFHYLADEKVNNLSKLNFKNSNLKNSNSNKSDSNKNSNKPQLCKFAESLSLSLEEITSLWKQVYRELTEELFELKKKQNDLENKRKELQAEIKELKENKILPAHSPTMKLKKILEENLVKENGEPVEVDILCEATWINDQEWQNAIEGYLNTQKFDILVEPGYFDEALGLYERHKFTDKIENVGLVNTEKLMKTKIKTKENSLAEEIKADKKHIRLYTDFLLGQIIKCNDEKELKNHLRAITKSCMLYQNYTARQIPERRYKPPYIGAEAVKTQLKLKEEELSHVENELAELEDKISNLKGLEALSGDSKEDRIKGLENDYEKIITIPELEKNLEDLNHQLLSIDTSELDRLKEEDKKIEKQVQKLEEEVNELLSKQGEIKQTIKTLEERLENIKKEKEELEKELSAFVEGKDETKISEWEKKWEKEASQKSPDVLKSNYEQTKKKLNTELEKKWRSLIQLRSNFNHEFDFSANPQSDTGEEYQNRYQVLIESHLADYEEQAKEVREKAEQSFREHFVAKLRENIEIAKEEVEELNRALKDMKFGSDSYRFKVSAKPELKNYHEMIMDPQLHEGHNLFSESFRHKHGETINELFRDISADEDAFQERMQELTDYRSYLEFEIEITDINGNKSNFSKVAREKSGGETQVPFYVAILASFYQSYGMYRKTDTLRLVVFDEAFNRMDADRVEEAIRFIKTLGFQPLIAAPTGRIQLIAPHINTNLIVMKEGFTSFVEQVSRKELLEDETPEPSGQPEPS
ncbi:ATP-binding protein [Natranaerofaba carboxydovora]|uniref:ATP-binding protein n=1 Tax=Natranaerofaba carboxydovora TaxID=2742683 RepID=UPI001F1466E5|nr:SbcC/MukB-like Walker B domain-containing protein [Natranaerofaba carboxydovora]UMZ74965.1 Chromosome partition protein MukB [Natranaerofaba carboxydovora]